MNTEVEKVSSKKNMPVSSKARDAGVQMTHSLPPVGEFFDEAVVTDKTDLLIPRILLMQGVSGLVGQSKAMQGDIIDSVSLEVLANPKSTVEVIPIKMLDKEWSVDKWNGKKFEFDRVDPWDESLKNKLEFEEKGVKYRRNARLSFYVLLARDAQVNHIPYMISFQRTGYKAGKNLASWFTEALLAYKMGDKGSIPMSLVFEIGCHVETGDNGTYFVMDARRSRKSRDEETTKAVYWFQQLKTVKVEVHPEKEVSSEEIGSEREF